MTTSNEAMIEANTFDANGNISPKTFQFSQHLQEPPGVKGNVTKKKNYSVQPTSVACFHLSHGSMDSISM